MSGFILLNNKEFEVLSGLYKGIQQAGENLTAKAFQMDLKAMKILKQKVSIVL